MIGILRRKEYRALAERSSPHNSPVEIVSPEREKPGSAANPWAIAIRIAVFKSRIDFFSKIFFDTYSLNKSKKPVKVSKTPTAIGENTKNSAISCNG